MSNYSDTIARFFSARTVYGDGTVPLGLVVAARVADAIDPGQLRNVQDRLLYRDHALNGMGDLYQVIAVPGARIRDMTAPASLDTFLVNTANPPTALLGDFTADDIASQIGAINAEFLRTLHAIWADRLSLTGIWSADQIKRAALVCSLGGVCYPENPAVMERMFPKLGSGLWSPAFRDARQEEAYRKVVELVKPAVGDYVNRQYAEAVQAVKDAEASTAFWSTVYDVTEAVRDAPFTAAKLAAQGLLVGLGWKNITLLAVVGVAAGAWYFGAVPAILKAVKAKAP